MIARRDRRPVTSRDPRSKHLVLFKLERLIYERMKTRHPNVTRFLKDLILERLLQEGALTKDDIRKAIM